MSGEGEKVHSTPNEPNREDNAALLIEIAVSVYAAHSHQGRAYVSPGHAVEMAACIVGMARSDYVHGLVEGAIANPEAANLYANNIIRRAAGRRLIDQKESAVMFANALNDKDPDDSKN